MRGELTVYERREKIKSLLIKERSTTIMKLAYLYGVDKQTIRRDIAFLGSRLPLTTKPGCGGGVFLDSDFEAPKEWLNAEEENLLLQLSETLSEKDKLIIHNIINKFSVHQGR